MGAETVTREEFHAVLNSLKRIETALLGDSEMQIDGMAKKVDSHEKYIERDKNMKAKVAGGGIVAIPLLSEFWHWIKEHLFK